MLLLIMFSKGCSAAEHDQINQYKMIYAWCVTVLSANKNDVRKREKLQEIHDCFVEFHVLSICSDVLNTKY